MIGQIVERVRINLCRGRIQSHLDTLVSRPGPKLREHHAERCDSQHGSPPRGDRGLDRFARMQVCPELDVSLAQWRGLALVQRLDGNGLALDREGDVMRVRLRALGLDVDVARTWLAISVDGAKRRHE